MWHCYSRRAEKLDYASLSGMTVHSWGAVTPGNNDTDSQIRFIRTCKPALQRWKNVKIMIIDEGKLSMWHSLISGTNVVVS